MNNRELVLTVDLPISTVKLNRGRRGLGFHIGGGSDMPHVRGDSGIYVTQIKHGGAAYKDGRLKTGDRLVALDGISMEDISHTAAVKAFINSGETIHLRVQHGAKNYIMENRKNIERYSMTESPKLKTCSLRKPGLECSTFLVLIAGCSMVAYLLYKYRPWTHCVNKITWIHQAAPKDK